MKVNRTRNNIAALVGLGVLLLIFVLIGLQTDKGPASPNSTYSPAIPESKKAAKDFIDQASAKAEVGDFRGAVVILEQALLVSPDDQNLKLTKEYYENEAVRNGQ